jgi:hypothetical protein
MEKENFTPEQKQQALFLQLVMMFQQAAWAHLGKVPNPMTQKIERDLEQARMSIDMIDMLKTRTQGNISDEENNLLEHALRELKLNYIDELDKDKKEAASTEAKSTNENANEQK